MVLRMGEEGCRDEEAAAEVLFVLHERREVRGRVLVVVLVVRHAVPAEANRERRRESMTGRRLSNPDTRASSKGVRDYVGRWARDPDGKRCRDGMRYRDTSFGICSSCALALPKSEVGGLPGEAPPSLGISCPPLIT